MLATAAPLEGRHTAEGAGGGGGDGWAQLRAWQGLGLAVGDLGPHRVVVPPQTTDYEVAVVCGGVGVRGGGCVCVCVCVCVCGCIVYSMLYTYMCIV
jgi:hypothetical protein